MNNKKQDLLDALDNLRDMGNALNRLEPAIEELEGHGTNYTKKLVPDWGAGVAVLIDYARDLVESELGSA